MYAKSLGEWFELATPAQRDQLNAAFDRVVLSQLRADPFKKHHRGASAQRAGEIEAVVASIPGAPVITRGDICQACHECSYWRNAVCQG